VSGSCAWRLCFRPVPAATTGRPAVYCGAACRQAAHRDRVRQADDGARQAAELAAARSAASVLWPQIEPAAADVADLALAVVSCAADDDPFDPGALAVRLAELRAAVAELEDLALSFRAAADRAAVLAD
jgi:hypothetical protein